MLDCLIKADRSATSKTPIDASFAFSGAGRFANQFFHRECRATPRLPVSRGWVASRTLDSEIKRFHVFHFAARACARAIPHRHLSGLAPAEHAEDEISIHRVQDRYPAAIRSWCHNFRARE